MSNCHERLWQIEVQFVINVGRIVKRTIFFFDAPGKKKTKMFVAH